MGILHLMTETIEHTLQVKDIDNRKIYGVFENVDIMIVTVFLT